MLRRYLVLVLMVTLYQGCSNDTITPPGGVFGTDLSFSRTATPSLNGGGRFFGQKDTGVWYDANFSYSVKNTSTTDHSFTYRLEVGLFKDGKYQTANGVIAYDEDSVFSGNVAATIYNKSTGTVAITKTIGMGRRTNDWSMPYGYRLTIFDKQSGDSAAFEGLFDGSTADNRFRGIVYTTEQSPDSLGVLDGPDDGDWQHQNNDVVIASPINPNPCSKQCSINFAVQESATVEISLKRTITDSVLSFKTALLSPGFHVMDMDVSTIASGMYRLYIKGIAGTTTSVNRGDILILN